MPGAKRRTDRAKRRTSQAHPRPEAPAAVARPSENRPPTFADATRRVALRYIGPLYVPVVVAAAWIRFSDESWGLRAGLTTIGLLLAVTLFVWGAWKWAGIPPWAARIIGLAGMFSALIFATDVAIIGGPLLLFALPMAWPGATGADGRHRFLR